MAFYRMKRSLSTFLNHINHETTDFREEIISVVRDYMNGQWQNATSGSVVIQRLRGGFSNSIFQVTLSNNDLKEPEEPKSIIMRFHQPLDHGSVFENLSELLAFTYLSERRLGPKLHAIFPGGRIEEYIDARPLKTDELGDLSISLAIAEKMAILHSVKVPLSKKKGLVFDTMEKWLMQTKRLPSLDRKINSETQKCIDYFRNLDLAGEISWLRDFLGNSGSPVLFCHNDVQEGNILLSSNSFGDKKPKLFLIDYEYCFYNFRGFEFANHFLEYTMNYEPKNYPHFVINEENYPSVQHQSLFFRRYLSTSKQLEQRLREIGGDEIGFYSSFDFCDVDEASPAEEAELLKETSNFRLASHLFWGIWAALRSNSPISFGYWEYCDARLKAYYKTKEEIKFQEKV